MEQKDGAGTGRGFESGGCGLRPSAGPKECGQPYNGPFAHETRWKDCQVPLEGLGGSCRRERSQGRGPIPCPGLPLSVSLHDGGSVRATVLM